MLQYDFENSVGCWLAMTSQAMRRNLANELASEGITSRQWEVLCWIAMEGELSQSELSDRIGIEAPTLVGILDRMQRDGWITRHRCDHDKRRKLIRANPSAEPVWAKIVVCAKRIRQRATEGLSAQQIESLKQCLAQIRENLSAGAVTSIDIE